MQSDLIAPLRRLRGAARESGVAGEEKGLATQVAAPFLSGQLTPDNVFASHARREHDKSKNSFRRPVQMYRKGQPFEALTNQLSPKTELPMRALIAAHADA